LSARKSSPEKPWQQLYGRVEDFGERLVSLIEEKVGILDLNTIPEDQLFSRLKEITQEDSSSYKSLIISAPKLKNNTINLISLLEKIIKSNPITELQIDQCLTGISCALLLGLIRTFLAERTVEKLKLSNFEISDSRFNIITENLEDQTQIGGPEFKISLINIEFTGSASEDKLRSLLDGSNRKFRISVEKL